MQTVCYARAPKPPESDISITDPEDYLLIGSGGTVTLFNVLTNRESVWHSPRNWKSFTRAVRELLQAPEQPAPTLGESQMGKKSTSKATPDENEHLLFYVGYAAATAGKVPDHFAGPFRSPTWPAYPSQIGRLRDACKVAKPVDEKALKGDRKITLTIAFMPVRPQKIYRVRIVNP